MKKKSVGGINSRTSCFTNSANFFKLHSLFVVGQSLMRMRRAALSSRPPCGLLHLPFHSRNARLKFRLESFEIEACTFLHGWKLDERWRPFGDLLLKVNEAPEFVFVEIGHVHERAGVSLLELHPLERIEPEIGQDRPIQMDRSSEPAVGLIDKSEF